MTVPILANAYGWDRACAALFMHARDGETMSQMIGLAARRGEPWGRWGAAFLSWAVEPDHCDRALAGDGRATSGRAAIMSGALLLVVFAGLTLAAWGGWALVFWFATTF